MNHEQAGPFAPHPTAPGRKISATTSRSDCQPGNGFRPLRHPALAGIPLATPVREQQYPGWPSAVPCRRRRPGSRHLYAGHHLASNPGNCQAHPGVPCAPRFRCHHTLVTTPQTVNTPPGNPARALSAQRLPGPRLTPQRRLFPSRSPRQPHDHRSTGRLETTPRRAIPRGHKTLITCTARQEDHLTTQGNLLVFDAHARIQHAARKRREITGTIRTMRSRAGAPTREWNGPPPRVNTGYIRSSELSNVQSRHRPPDDHPLDFARALEDREDLGVGQSKVTAGTSQVERGTRNPHLPACTI